MNCPNCHADLGTVQVDLYLSEVAAAQLQGDATPRIDALLRALPREGYQFDWSPRSRPRRSHIRLPKHLYDRANDIAARNGHTAISILIDHLLTQSPHEHRPHH